MNKIFLILISLFSFLKAEVDQYAEFASKLPIAFSVVREDSDQDVEIIKRYFPEEKISMIMVASGGCTAANIIAKSKIKKLTLVDPNKAQLDLTKLKIHLLTLPTQKRLEILGYKKIQLEDRRTIIQGLMKSLDIDSDTLGNIDSGLDFIGRYEKVFEELRYKLRSASTRIEQLFLLTSIDEQAKFIAPESSFGAALDFALDEVMSQDNLVKIFGFKATANRVQDFSKHFAQQIRKYLSTHLASESPWLAYMLLGRFHNEVMFPWLSANLNKAMPKINYINNFMNHALEQSASDSYHVVHLSNIIDWLTPQEAKQTLELAYKVLKPGGCVVIRQLNSNVDIVKLGVNFDWDLKASKDFLDNDRSFFYRNFFIGFKKKECLAPKVKEAADNILKENPIIEGNFFKDLPGMDKQVFQRVQSQFFFAVDYFSRPMAALVARTPLHKDRIDIIHNIVEEHGDFSVNKYHSNTFKQFLKTIGITSEELNNLQPSSVISMFNYTLMGVCANEDPLIAIACNGIIEYAFADISALIGKQVVQRNWVTKKDLVHYNLHADIDKQHAEEFFKIIEPYMNNIESRKKILSGLRLGAYIFNKLYEDLYLESKLNN